MCGKGCPAGGEKHLGVLLDKFTPSHQCALVAKKADGVLGPTEKSMDIRSREVHLPFHSALVRPQQECLVQFWALQTERVQWKAMETMRGFQHLCCEERLGELGLCSLQKSSLREQLFNVLRCSWR